MSNFPLRFVHAADFHLEKPLGGVPEAPGHLRDTFVDAAYEAAEKVFHTVLAEDAQFLVLAGDILDPHSAGARGVLFLVDQFERLCDRHVPVYWIGGNVDPPDSWPASAPLPDNVYMFPRGKPTETVFVRDERPCVRLCGASRTGQTTIRAGDYTTVDDGLFSIAIAHGNADEGALTQQPIDYWALGGQHRRRTLATAPVGVHYAGSPQGRNPSETGSHGCTLVDVDENRKIKTSLVATDVLRWHGERLVIEPDTDQRKLEQLMRDRTQRVIDGSAGRHLMISWTIAGSGQLVGALRRGRIAGELLTKLRTEYGQQSAAVWTISIETESPGAFPDAWYEEETMLGEFLRNVQSLQMDGAERIDLDRYLGRNQNDNAITAAVQLTESHAREEVLREAAALGVDLLRGASAERDLLGLS